MVRFSPEQNQVTTVARRNGWTMKRRGGYHVWSREGRQVMLAYSKDEGTITSLYIDGSQVRVTDGGSLQIGRAHV